MRLLDVFSGEFAEFSDPQSIPPYAILSHRWSAVEQTYQDVLEIQKLLRFKRLPSLSPPSLQPSPSSDVEPEALGAIIPSIWDNDRGLSDKVRNACQVAREDGFQYIWIDSCCIDKTSSSELSESINSMFAWYGDAEVCYAFLADSTLR